MNQYYETSYRCDHGRRVLGLANQNSLSGTPIKAPLIHS
jgi:hypothetical protein